jgi:hypothetical protein
MRHARPAARRRGRRPLRVVGPAERPDVPLGEEAVYAVNNGLEAANYLEHYFPHFYRAHVERAPLHTGRLLGCCMALWQLTQLEGLKLRWPNEGYGRSLEFDCQPDPAETFAAYDWASEEFLSEVGYFLTQPRPEYFGLGVQVAMEMQISDPLTLLLWWLTQDTPLALGIDLYKYLQDVNVQLADEIMRLRPLPPVEDIHALLDAVARELPESAGLARPADLFLYAFGRTSNPLANTNEAEILEVHGAMDEADEWGWDEVDRLAVMSREAEQLSDAYEHIGDRLTPDPFGYRALRNLAARFYRAARRLRDTTQRKKSLIEIFAELPPESGWKLVGQLLSGASLESLVETP